MVGKIGSFEEVKAENCEVWQNEISLELQEPNTSRFAVHSTQVAKRWHKNYPSYQPTYERMEIFPKTCPLDTNKVAPARDG